MSKMYEVWATDLTSLYDEIPSLPFRVSAEAWDLDEAFRLAMMWQDHKTASWVMDPETRELVPMVEMQ